MQVLGSFGVAKTFGVKKTDETIWGGAIQKGYKGQKCPFMPLKRNTNVKLESGTPLRF